MGGPGDEDRETLRPEEALRPAVRSVPTLTILFHPETARVGERHRVRSLRPGEALPISRTSPIFGATALGDPCLSRRPFALVGTADGGLVLDRV